MRPTLCDMQKFALCHSGVGVKAVKVELVTMGMNMQDGTAKWSWPCEVVSLGSPAAKCWSVCREE
jgi:hypothetical protein